MGTRLNEMMTSGSASSPPFADHQDVNWCCLVRMGEYGNHGRDCSEQLGPQSAERDLTAARHFLGRRRFNIIWRMGGQNSHLDFHQVHVIAAMLTNPGSNS